MLWMMTPTHDAPGIFRPWTVLRPAFLGLLNALYPRVCVHCDDLLPTSSPSHGGVTAWFCQPCQAALTPILPPYCSVCGESFEGSMTSDFRCSNCQDRRLSFDFAVSGYKAEGPLRHIIHAFKYGKNLGLRSVLADLLGTTLSDPRLANEDLQQWLLVPVPLHWTRQFGRGFNQSWELCQSLSKSMGIPTAQVLRRQVRTRTQTRLTRAQRLANLRRGFALRRVVPWSGVPVLTGKRILLVDDVLTTGATAHECAKILKREGGAEKVVVITAARG